MSDDVQMEFETRYGQRFPALDELEPQTRAKLENFAGHASQRRFSSRDVSPEMVELLAACAFAAPSKSDLQLRDIIVIRDPERKAALAGYAKGADFLAEASVVLVFCGNAGRLVDLAHAEGQPFPNNHADLLVNAVADAAISLGWCQLAAAQLGLAGCAVSGLRDHAADVSTLLELPKLCFPFAGFALGWPDEPRQVTPRLPLALTLHNERHSGTDDAERIATYDVRRRTLGRGGWARTRARQYSVPLRANFGAFLRRIGFDLN